MAVQSFRKNYVYRYKLTDSCKDERRQIAGTTLTKSWIDFKAPKQELEIFIKTSIKPEGIIDFEKKDLISNEIIQQSTWTGEIPEIISREVLHAMERFELVPIAKYYLIDCVNKDSKMLIKLITEAQNKRIKTEEKQKEVISIKQENKNNEIDITNNSMIPQQYMDENIIEKRGGFFGFGNKR
jgi:hypothetical protein